MSTLRTISFKIKIKDITIVNKTKNIIHYLEKCINLEILYIIEKHVTLTTKYIIKINFVPYIHCHYSCWMVGNMFTKQR